MILHQLEQLQKHTFATGLWANKQRQVAEVDLRILDLSQLFSL
jgi:hypothetical protein